MGYEGVDCITYGGYTSRIDSDHSLLSYHLQVNRNIRSPCLFSCEMSCYSLFSWHGFHMNLGEIAEVVRALTGLERGVELAFVHWQRGLGQI